MSKFAVPAGWNLANLGSVLKRVRTSVEVEPEKLYREIGIRSHGKGIFYKNACSGISLGNKSVFWIEPDCFIVNIVFAWEQAVAKTTENEKGMIASHRFPMYKPVDGKLDLDYIVYFFKTPFGKHLLGLASPGGAGRNKTLGQDEFQKLTIALPSYSEQRKIAEILSAWDEAIAKSERLIAALRERKKSLMQRLLTGQVRFPGFDDEWEQVHVRDVFQRVTRKVGAKKIEHVLSITARVGFVDQRKKFGKVIAGKNLENYVLLQKDEFAYNKGNSNFYPQGCIYLLEEFPEGAVPSVYFSFAVKSKSQVNSHFYKHYFESGALNRQLEKHITSGVRGNGLFNIAFDDFFSVKILLPPIEEQEKIAVMLDTCDSEIKLRFRKLEALKQQKKGLTQRLLTGQMRVKI